jgi:hypothetical protein
MALHHNPRIVTSGFHIHVDPADFNCYAGSGTSIVDLSGNGRTMTLTNGALVSEGAFILDGSNDHVAYGYGTIFNWTAIPWTVMFWARATDFTYPSVLDLISAGNGHFRFDLLNTGIQVLFRTPGGSSTALTSYASTVNTGQWYHCAFTREGTTFKSYLNGVLGSTNTNANFTNSAGMTVIRIGYSSDNDAADRTFEGSVGPLTIYERVLFADEVLQNYLAQKSRFGL